MFTSTRVTLYGLCFVMNLEQMTFIEVFCHWLYIALRTAESFLSIAALSRVAADLLVTVLALELGLKLEVREDVAMVVEMVLGFPLTVGNLADV